MSTPWGGLQAGAEEGSRNKSQHEGHVPTSRASSNGDKEADLSSGASVVVLLLIGKIHWGMNRHCARLFYKTVKWTVSQPGKLYGTSLKVGVKRESTNGKTDRRLRVQP